MKTDWDKETEAKRQALLKAISELTPLEVTWAFGILESAAEQRIKEREEESMRHAHFGREAEAARAMERVPFYNKLIQLRELWRDFECHWSAPSIVEAVTGRPAQTRPSKKVQDEPTRVE